MLDKRLLWTGIALAAVIMTTVVAVSLPQREESIPLNEVVEDVEKPAGEDPPPPYAYLLREYQGRIAVYTAGQEEPDMVLNVMVKHLPEYDRRQLEEGITVASYSELESLIEDFSS